MEQQIQTSPAVVAPVSGPGATAAIRVVEISSDDELKKGIIHTDVEPFVARLICLAFLVLISVVPVSQLIVELMQGRRPQMFDVFLAPPVKANLKRYEDELARASIARQWVQPRVQTALSTLGFGNSKAIVGRDGWLFYEPGVRYVGGLGVLAGGRIHPPRGKLTDEDTRAEHHPDPRPAIFEFNAQCKRAGVHLLLLPIPDKAMLQARELSARFSSGAEVPDNPDRARLFAELREAGVDVLDLTPKTLDGQARFLRGDTHWTPEWMRDAAGVVAHYLKEHGLLGKPGSAPEMRVESSTSTSTGDLVQMLKLPLGQQLFPAQQVKIERICDRAGAPWQPSRESSLLVLGDSFSNIYSLDSMGWGESAGFVEHLSYALQAPVDRIVRNDAGAFATREILSRELARGNDRLAGKTILIWEFAMRELTAGDWKPIPMALGAPQPHRFIAPSPGMSVAISGTIVAAAPAPRPGAVPYKDHIIAVHVADLKAADPNIDGREALVYVWSMRDNVLTPAAHYREGDSVNLRLRAWSELEAKLGSINRAELPDDALLQEEPFWGELEIH